MASRSQQLPNANISHVEEEVPAQAAEDEEEEEVEQNAKEEEDEVGEEEEWGFDDDSEDDNSSSRQHYNEPEVLIHQNTSSQILQSWSTNQDQEITDDSYHFPSPSSLLSQSSNIPSAVILRLHEILLWLIYYVNQVYIDRCVGLRCCTKPSMHVGHSYHPIRGGVLRDAREIIRVNHRAVGYFQLTELQLIT
ncbi:hypothetical protein RND71_035183 [Anisodus tanguticus]|uniref:Uncharacterized protein n=1 Tax=Anisodus tanguticus TaxID=243964 RepID=A0AAE1UVM5_9SOLA|nr:hypothetical protein RND71_035183 [Anisodus tanguticus]